METSPVHFMEQFTYHVPCGDGDKIFSEGHGASIYREEVTCEKCIKIITPQPECDKNCDDPNCPYTH